MSTYSIVIATHRRPALLARALKSIRNQAFSDVTVLVVSDEQCLETYNVANSYLSQSDVYIERRGAPGPAASRNVALRLIASDHVLFLDDDDEFSPDFLSSAQPHLAVFPNDVLFGNYYAVTEGDDRATPNQVAPELIEISGKDPASVYVINYIPNSCLIYPAAALTGKSFDDTLVINEDWEFLLNAIQNRTLRHIPIAGPVIHRTPREKRDRRGSNNDHLLPKTQVEIYRKWPAPAADLRLARQRLLASVGIALSAEEL